ncbi:Alpha/beta hydrolase [Caballeronia peredens]|nr:Alpha/beta hydrolase [Caballeronia peredens]
MPQSRTMHANGIDIAYEVFGRDDDPAILLVMGNSAPGLVWPDAFCEMLASAGLRVIRFDQRDTGWSSFVDFDRAPYTLDDLARDAFALLDDAGVARAHVAGLSQGGVIAYRMALQQPARVASVSILMSSADVRPKNDAFANAPPKEGELARPAADYVARVIALNSTPPRDVDEIAQRFVDNFRLAKGPRSPFDEPAWQMLGRAFAERLALRPDGLTPALANNSNHARAQKATATLTAADLSAIALPVLIVHGSDDPIFPAAHAHWAAAMLRDAELRIIDTMGHALDPAFFRAVADALTGFCLRPAR